MCPACIVVNSLITTSFPITTVKSCCDFPGISASVPITTWELIDELCPILTFGPIVTKGFIVTFFPICEVSCTKILWPYSIKLFILSMVIQLVDNLC